MTQLDLDTTTLAAVGADLRAGATTLAGARAGALTAAAAPGVSGDVALSAAVEDLAAAWRSAHESLVGALVSLGAGLSEAAEVFAGAERGTVRDLAALLGAAGTADGA
ncbi:hypothetical protein [Isoptericola sp. NPDC056605]|uniref:hypothetical protein n=1 Tax=Isoptericola sp. NPDC056605 TaxID=3345876 RepID=UPI0036B20116